MGPTSTCYGTPIDLGNSSWPRHVVDLVASPWLFHRKGRCPNPGRGVGIRNCRPPSCVLGWGCLKDANGISKTNRYFNEKIIKNPSPLSLSINNKINYTNIRPPNA